MILKRIGPLSCAKVSGALYAAIGLLLGLFFALLSLIGSGLAAASDQSGAFGFLFGAGSIVILPIFYGVIGFLSGLISAALYNLFAGFVGGIELDLE